MATRVGSRELKTRMGRYLRLVKSGGIVVVTERGRAVAKLTPLDDDEKEPESRLEEMVARGELTRGSGRPLPEFEPIEVPGVSLGDAIAADREDRV